jgi:hypothetical protein
LEKSLEISDENMAITHDRAILQYQTEIKLDKKSRFGGNCFMEHTRFGGPPLTPTLGNCCDIKTGNDFEDFEMFKPFK